MRRSWAVYSATELHLKSNGGASLSYKSLQLSPQASTQGIRAKVAVQDRWCASVTSSREMDFSPFSTQDEFEWDGADHKGLISGLALSVAFSASFWAGVAWIIARALR